MTIFPFHHSTYFLFMIVILSCFFGCQKSEVSHVEDATTKIKVKPVSVEEMKAAIYKGAKKCGVATVSGDHITLVTLMFPEAVRMMGGAKKVIDILTAGESDMSAKGITIESVDITPPTQIESSDTYSFAVVPIKIIMSVPTGKLTTNAFLVAISNKNDNDWTFLDGSKANSEAFHILFPNFPSSLIIPKVEEPVFESSGFQGLLDTFFPKE